MKEITIKQFNELPDDEKRKYKPIYLKYKKVRQKSYCDDCGHFTGYYYTEKPVGKPEKYIEKTQDEILNDYMNRGLMEMMMKALDVPLNWLK